MSKADITAAEIRFHTRLVFGRGRYARISECGGGAPLVRLFETREQCEELARLGKKCGPDCLGPEYHRTEEILPLVDECPYELGYRK